MKISNIYLGSDHAGFALKEKLKKYFSEKKIKYIDMGNLKYDENDDYPQYAFLVGEKVAADKNAKGILVCGSGIGMSIAANKVKGIRAVAPYDAYSAKMSRLDNDSNICALNGKRFSFEKAKSILNIWLSTEFSQKSRHIRRLKKISAFERKK